MKCKTKNFQINIIIIIVTYSVVIKSNIFVNGNLLNIQNSKGQEINENSNKFSFLTRNNLRIIGGQKAKPYSAPYIVSIKRGIYGKHGCGGSIITSKIILTAAHCLKNENLTDIYVVAGLYDRNDDNKFVQKRQVRNYIKHENFETTNTSGPYDLALLFLDEPFNFNEKITKVELPNSSHIKLNKHATLYGWGRTNPKGQERPNLLQTITTNLLTYEECKKILPNNQRLHWTNICTSRQGQDSIACHGDSGGPLVQINKKIKYNMVDDKNNRNENVIQVGIVSWGFRICGWNSKPSIYTNVAVHLDWIWKNVRQHELISNKFK